MAELPLTSTLLRRTARFTERSLGEQSALRTFWNIMPEIDLNFQTFESEMVFQKLSVPTVLLHSSGKHIIPVSDESDALSWPAGLNCSQETT